MDDNYDVRDYDLNEAEKEYDKKLRPHEFEEFKGQEKIIENLKVFVEAARLRNEALVWGKQHSPISLPTSLMQT